MSGALGGWPSSGGNSPTSSPAKSQDGIPLTDLSKTKDTKSTATGLTRQGSTRGRVGSVSTASTASTGSELGGKLTQAPGKTDAGASTSVSLPDRSKTLQRTSTFQSTGSGSASTAKKDASKKNRRSLIAKRTLPLYFEI